MRFSRKVLLLLDCISTLYEALELIFWPVFIADDEIDVVSIIEKPVKRKSPQPCNNNNNISKTIRSHDQPAAKRAKMNPKRLRGDTNKDTRENCVDSDQESTGYALTGKDKFEDPECKRNVHNVLERKRRNDLKYSFQVLRDSIPDLKGSERAPKVAILRKATDCILNLRSEQERLLEEKDSLEKSHQSLVRKLKALKESSWKRYKHTQVSFLYASCLYVIKVKHIYIYTYIQMCVWEERQTFQSVLIWFSSKGYARFRFLDETQWSIWRIPTVYSTNLFSIWKRQKPFAFLSKIILIDICFESL